MRIACISFLLIAVTIARGQAVPETEKVPNILFIAVDDLRPETECYGAGHMVTPNIDRLASDGVLFDRAYCQQAICMASRASIMSGIRPENRKIYTCEALMDLAPEIPTLNEHFANHGYSTYSIGKIYHHGSDRVDQFGDQWFDPAEKWAGRGYLSDEAIAEMDINSLVNPNKAEKGPAYEMLDVPDNYYLDGVNAEHAIAKLKSYRKSKQPFFLAFGLHKPHLPWCAPKKYWDLYPPDQIELSPAPDFPEYLTPFSLTNWGELRGYFGIPQGEDPIPDELAAQLRRAYYASVSYADAQIGRVLDALKKNGLADNTIVILWGDHGWKLGDHHAWSKHTNFELDTRVPLIIKTPGMKQAGTTSSSFAEFTDIYPTLCDLAGLPLPGHLQGESLVPVLEDPQKQIRDQALSIFPRSRNNDKKTITGLSVKTDQFRYTEWIHLQSGMLMAAELYDHKKDPLENINVAEEESYTAARSMMSARLHAAYDHAIPGIRKWPDVWLYDPAKMVRAKELAENGTAPWSIAVDSLISQADALLDKGPWTVIQKKKTPPSGNKHDYYSLGVYWWPDPASENGLPYIRKDGYSNPEVLEYDGPGIHNMAESVFTLALAWFYTSEKAYAEKAVSLLHAWFLDPETKMNPHLEYGQAIPGITEGRGIGIIETDVLTKVVNGIGMLKGSEVLHVDILNGLKEWFSDYTEWLITSENGWAERMWHNNHGNSYDLQTSSFALFTGNDSLARLLLDSAKVKRIQPQIEADGSQPLELARTKAMSYSLMNTKLLVNNAILARHLGIDLWNYKAPEGASIMQSIRYLVPYYTRGKEFTYQQINGIEPYRSRLVEILWMAQNFFPDQYLEKTIRELKPVIPEHSRLHLLYPNLSK